ncbi:MAG: class I SAM-dependent methyltransferase [Acidimicrobiia bacterium]
MKDPRIKVVRDGYDAIAANYLADRPLDAPDVELLRELGARLAPNNRVLDAGCGAGVPVTKWLVDSDLQAFGLDVSRNQLGLAQDLVVGAALTQADLVDLPFRDNSFQAVVSYYAIIHVPREQHRHVFEELHRVTERGGLALLCLGANDIPEDHDPESWLGVPMFWSHFDAQTNLEMLQHAGLEVLWNRTITDPMNESQHLFVLARCS